MRSSLGRCGAARVWAGTLTAGLLSLFGCSGEAEVTTLPEGASADLQDPSRSADSPSRDGKTPDGAGSDNGTISEAQPNPTGLSGRAPDGAAADDRAAAANSGSDVPDSDHCAAVSDWDPEWVAIEEEVLSLVNENRSRAADCGVDGRFAAAPPLVMDPILRCSARLQSLDMFERNFFDHTNPDGKDPFERMDAAGFKGGGAGENIAVGQLSPEQVMRSWMDSDGHCSNVMRANYTMLGIGYHPGAGGRGLGSNYWTQNFGAPARGCRNGCR
jgi:uncharacterized protein YkwD